LNFKKKKKNKMSEQQIIFDIAKNCEKEYLIRKSTILPITRTTEKLIQKFTKNGKINTKFRSVFMGDYKNTDHYCGTLSYNGKIYYIKSPSKTVVSSISKIFLSENIINKLDILYKNLQTLQNFDEEKFRRELKEKLEKYKAGVLAEEEYKLNFLIKNAKLSIENKYQQSLELYRSLDKNHLRI
jgi:hypothetical protein